MPESRVCVFFFGLKQPVVRLSALGGDVGNDGGGKAADRHGLEIHLAGTGDDGVEKTLAAEEDVLDALDALNADLAGLAHRGKIAGVDDNLLTGLQIVFHHRAVDLGKRHALTAELLHDEALAAEEAGADSLLEEDGELYARFSGKEAPLLHDNAVGGGDVEGDDGAGEAGGEGDNALTALRGVDVLEHRLAAEHSAECLADTAVGACFHEHVGAHPAHRAALGDHLFTRLKCAGDDRQRGSYDFISHKTYLTLI